MARYLNVCNNNYLKVNRYFKIELTILTTCAAVKARTFASNTPSYLNTVASVYTRRTRTYSSLTVNTCVAKIA